MKKILLIGAIIVVVLLLIYYLLASGDSQSSSANAVSSGCDVASYNKYITAMVDSGNTIETASYYGCPAVGYRFNSLSPSGVDVVKNGKQISVPRGVNPKSLLLL
jgi:hypothetical protein